MYVKRHAEGRLQSAPDIRVEKTAAATALVDGDNGMGHLVMARAAETAVELARDAGVAWVGTRRSNHAGAAGVYAAMTLPHDMVGIYGVVASANHMPVWGGVELLLGTNPVAVAIPAGEEAPIVLDIATSVVSYGTIKSHRLQSKPMPEGWMVNAKDGKPLTDASRSGEGLLLPIGGYKGSGLSLVLGLLAGPLNGAAFGRDVFDFNFNDTDRLQHRPVHRSRSTSSASRRSTTFKAEMDRHLRDLRTSKPLPGRDHAPAGAGAPRAPRRPRQERRADAARIDRAARSVCGRARRQAARRAVNLVSHAVQP